MVKIVIDIAPFLLQYATLNTGTSHMMVDHYVIGGRRVVRWVDAAQVRYV